jgi:hypothetical protein
MLIGSKNLKNNLTPLNLEMPVNFSKVKAKILLSPQKK